MHSLLDNKAAQSVSVLIDLAVSTTKSPEDVPLEYLAVKNDELGMIVLSRHLCPSADPSTVTEANLTN